jgi:hypothetical protein
MAALTALAIGLGAASLGAGLYEKVEGDKKANAAYSQMAQGQQIAAQGAAQMHNLSIAQAQTSVVFAQQNQAINQAANLQSLNAAQQSAGINSQIINFNNQIQAQHQRAMELDAQRQQIENVRQQQRARASSLTAATAQGARFGSGLQGGYGQISGQGNTNAVNISQNLQIGENVFGLNNQVSQQNVNMQQLQGLYAQQRADTQTQMSDLLYRNAVSNAGFQTQYADAQQTISQGTGQTSLGQGQLGQANMQSQLGSTLINAGPQIMGMGQTLSNMLPTMQNYFTPTPSNNPIGSAFGGGVNLNGYY